MPHSETIQKFALEGPLSAGQLVMLGLAVAAALALLAWRYASIAGSPKKFLFLFFMRLGALLVALWMLAGATLVSVRRETRPRSVIFMVDSSASMGLVDPVDGSGGTLRWSGAESDLGSASPVAALDAVIGTLESARSDVTRIGLLGDGEPGSSKKLWGQVQTAVESASDSTARLAGDAARIDTDSGAELDRVSAFLKDDLALMNRTGAGPLADRLEDCNTFLTAAIQRLDRQSGKLAAAFEKNPGAANQKLLTARAGLSRAEKVAGWLNEGEKTWLKDAAGRANVERYTFSSDVYPVAGNDWSLPLSNSNNPANNSTDIAGALSRVAQEAGKESIDAVVLVTDGGHNTSGDPREAAGALHDVPLYIVPIGTVEMPRDVILHHVHAPRAMFKNDTALIEAMVTAYDCDGEQLVVELLNDGAVADKRTIDVNSRMFDGRVRFEWKGVATGRHSLQVRVLPVPKELTLDNNEARVEVEVMEDTIRVLVADDLPRWEFRYLVNLFKRDKHVEYEQLLFEPNDDSQTTAQPTLPLDSEGWRKYRVVILGDLNASQLTPAQQELLRRYVSEEGGNLIVVAGQTAMPQLFLDQKLGAMLPVTTSLDPPNPTQPYSLVVTAEGSTAPPIQLDDDPLASERIWREMSTKLPIYNLSPIAKPKATAHVLISAVSSTPGAEQEAFLSWQYVGLGRVVYIAAPVTYQLRYQSGDLYHNRFWGQLLRWAIARDMSTGSKTVRLLTDKTAYNKGDTAQIGVRLNQLDGQPVAGAQCSIEVRQDGKVIKVVPLHEEPGSPGAYRGTLDDLPLGALTLRAAGGMVETLLKSENHPDPVEQIVNVDPQASAELNTPLCNLPLLGEIADTSGGSLTPPSAIANALADVNLVPDVQESLIGAPEPLWDRWTFLWIFIGFVAVEWIARKFWKLA